MVKKLLLAGGLVLLACNSLPEPRKIHQAVQPYFNDGSFNGVVLVARDDQIIFRESYGYADYGAKSVLNHNYAFYLASVSKSITAVCIAILHAEKRLGLNDSAAVYFPELKDLLQNVTIHHLLSHTSGVPDYYRFAQVDKGYNNSDVLRALGSQNELKFQPGSQHKYSNSNYILLAEIVSRVSKMPFSRFVQFRILDPLKMKQTFVYDGRQPPASLKFASRHSKEMQVKEYIFNTVGAGGIYSTVNDLFRFNLALMNGSLVKPEDIKPFYTGYAISKYEIPYGYGFYVPEGQNVVFHNGNLSGAHTMNYIDFEKRDMIIILANKRTDKIREITEQIARLL